MKKFIIVVFSLLVVGLSLSHLCYAQTLEGIDKDSWMNIFLANQMIGYMHYYVRKIVGEGDVRIKISQDIHLFMKVGDEDYKNDYKIESVVNKDFEVIHFKIEDYRFGAPVYVEGKRGDGTIELDMRRKGYSVHRSVKANKNVLSNLALLEKVIRDSNSAGEYQYDVFDEQLLMMKKVDVSIRVKDEEGSVAEIEIKDSINDAIEKIKVDKDGTILNITSESDLLQIIKSSKKDAMSGEREIPQNIISMVSSDRLILYPERLEYLMVNVLESQEAFPEGAMINDIRQSTRYNSADNYVEIAMKSKQNNLDGNVTPAKLSKEDMESFLTDTVFVETADKRIKKLVKEIVSVDDDNLTKVRKIDAWISENIESKYLPYLHYSARDTLDERQGDCKAFAVLFCALARASGVPTRMIVGLSIVPGGFMSHMWNEVYIDKGWLGIDTTVDQIGIDASHIKLYEMDMDYGSLVRESQERSYLKSIKKVKIVDLKGSPYLTGEEGRSVSFSPTLKKFPDMVLPVASAENIEIKDAIRIGVARFNNYLKDEDGKYLHLGLWYALRRNLFCIKKLSVLSRGQNPKGAGYDTKSADDLLRLCQKHGIDKFIYGSLHPKRKNIEVRIKIFDRATKETVALDIFIVSREEFQENIKRMAFRIADSLAIGLSKEEISRVSAMPMTGFENFCIYSKTLDYYEKEYALRLLPYLVFIFKNDPNYSFVYKLLGDVSFPNGYMTALLLDPYDAECYWNLCLSLKDQYTEKEMYEDARNLLKKAMAISPYFGKLHLSLGSRHNNNGYVEKGLRLTQKAQLLIPQDEYVYFNLGTMYDKLGRYEEALSAYRKTLEIDEKYYDVRFLISEIYRKQKEYGQAVKECLFVPEKERVKHGIYEQIGWIYYTNKDFQKALEYYKKALELNPNSPRAHLLLGHYYKDKESYALAMDYYKRGLGCDKNYQWMHNGTGNLYRELGQFDLALKEYNEELKLFGYDSGGILKENFSLCYQALGDNLVKEGNLDDAIEMYNKALEYNPDSGETYVNVADVYQKKGMKDESLEARRKIIGIFEKSLETDPDIAYYYLQIGSSYYFLSAYDQAISYCEKAIEKDPAYAQAYDYIGIIYTKLEQHEKAISYYKRFLEINPNVASTNTNIGLAYRSLRRFQEALNYYQKAIEINPEYADAYYQLGLTYVALKKYPDAIKQLKEAIKIGPDYYDYYIALGQAYGESGSFEDAIRSIKKAITLNKNNPYARNSLGYTYYLKKMHKMAMQQYDTGLRIAPDFALMHYNKALAHYALKEYTAALKHYDRATELGYSMHPRFRDIITAKGGMEKRESM